MTEEICYICRRTESKAGKMLHLPPNITICNDCMQKTLNAFNTSPMSDYLNMGGFTPDMFNGSYNKEKTGKADDKKEGEEISPVTSGENENSESR